MKGRRREVAGVIAEVTRWAQGDEGIDGLVLVGSYARGDERMASDVDLVLLTPDPSFYADDLAWFQTVRKRSRLIRVMNWGPVQERRFRLPSGLHVEIGVAPTNWTDIPLDQGTQRVLGEGHRVLHDPRGVLQLASESVR